MKVHPNIKPTKVASGHYRFLGFNIIQDRDGSWIWMQPITTIHSQFRKAGSLLDAQNQISNWIEERRKTA